jgi:hypothetical protein
VSARRTGSPKPSQLARAELSDIADYDVDRIKLKCRSPRIAVRFMDANSDLFRPGIPTRSRPRVARSHCHVSLTEARAEPGRLPRIRTRDPVPEIFQVRCLETDELFDPEPCSRARLPRRITTRSIRCAQFRRPPLLPRQPTRRRLLLSPAIRSGLFLS